MQRGNEVYIPNGDFVIESGDKLHITASHRDVAKFMHEIGVINTKVKTAIIIGGGRISFYLAKQLLESGIRVKIIEHNMNRCKELTEHLPKADIVCADGTDKHVLAQESLPYGNTGSLCSSFLPDRLVSLPVKRPYAITL